MVLYRTLLPHHRKSNMGHCNMADQNWRLQLQFTTACLPCKKCFYHLLTKYDGKAKFSVCLSVNQGGGKGRSTPVDSLPDPSHLPGPEQGTHHLPFPSPPPGRTRTGYPLSLPSPPLPLPSPHPPPTGTKTGYVPCLALPPLIPHQDQDRVATTPSPQHSPSQDRGGPNPPPPTDTTHYGQDTLRLVYLFWSNRRTVLF